MGWDAAVAALGGASDAWPRLVARYGEPHRRYHTLAHAAAVARDSARLAADLGAAERAVVAVAAWTHDVVYDAKPGDDERASAAWAREALERAGVGEAHVARVEQLVLATIGHDAPAGDRLATALLDADLAILGAPAPQYAAYARAVREEYAHYPDDVWRAGRAAVLEGLLARPVYRGAAARARWADAAAVNLAAELAQLTQPAQQTHWRGGGGDHR